MKRLVFLIASFLVVFGMSGCSAKEISSKEVLKENTFCTQDEHIVFSCELENKKTVSLCGKNKQMRYSYGSLEKVPKFTIRGGNELFKLSHYSTIYAMFKGLGFNNNGYSYHIVQQSIIRMNDESIGLIVLKNSNKGKLPKMVFGKECSNNIIVDNKLWYSSPYITLGFIESLNLLDNDNEELLYFSDLLTRKK